jgi:hypothetical protein
MDPVFIPNKNKRSMKEDKNRNGGCTGEANSYQSSLRDMQK